MSAVNNVPNNSSDARELQALIAANLAQFKSDEKNTDSKAILLQLSQTLLEVLEETNGSTGKSSDSKVVHPDFKASASSNSSTQGSPTSAQMQQELGKLMEILATLQGKIAQAGNTNAKLNASVAQSLIQEMQAMVKQANDQVKKVIEEEKQSSFLSIFTKVAECIAGVAISAIGLLLGQPEIAIIAMTFTVLAVSGGMDKITDVLADAYSQSLMANFGLSKEEADSIAKPLADATIIIASIVVTSVTCGVTAGTTAQTTAETIAGSAGETTEAALTTVSESVMEEQSAMQRLGSFFSKAGNFMKENNPFNKLPRSLNLGIVAGSTAVGTTNFGADFMAPILSNVKDEKTKEALQQSLGIVINLMAALAGGAAGSAVFTGPAAFQFNNISGLLKACMGLGLIGGVMQGGGQIGSGAVSLQLGLTTEEQGRIQALLGQLQALTTMNNQASNANAKALNAKLKAWAASLTSLSENLPKAEEAVARVLQA